jgi:hypothetical protein
VTTSALPEPDPIPGAADRRWDKLARDQQFSQLAEIRTTAEKWRNGLTGLTGLLAVVVAVAAPELSRDLPAKWRLIIGAPQLVALGALAFGAWNAMKAAFGKPAAIRDNGVRLREWSETETATAVGQMHIARNATFAGFIALAVAAGLAYTAPHRPSTWFHVVDRQGNAYCGVGRTNNDGTELTVTGVDGTEHRVVVGSLKSLTVSSSEC